MLVYLQATIYRKLAYYKKESQRIYNLIENLSDDLILNEKDMKREKNLLMQINTNFTTARTFLT